MGIQRHCRASASIGSTRPTVSHGCQMMLALGRAALLLIFQPSDDISVDELQIWLVDDRSAKNESPGPRRIIQRIVWRPCSSTTAGITPASVPTTNVTRTTRIP